MHKVETPSEVAKLRRCLNDLVSVIALPGLWADKEVGQIANTVVDALAGMLDLSFVLIRLNVADGGAPLEVMRATGSSTNSSVRGSGHVA